MNKDLLKNSLFQLGLISVCCILITIGVFALQQRYQIDEQQHTNANKAAKTFRGIAKGLAMSADAVAAAATMPTQRTSAELNGVSSLFIPLEPLGIADPGFDDSLFAGYIEVNMVGAAFSKRSPVPEIYRVDGKPVLGFASMVRNESGDAAGVVLLRASLDTIMTEVADSLSGGGQLSIYTGIDKATPLLGPAASHKVKVGTGNIAIGYVANDSSYGLSGPLTPLAITALIALTILAGVAIWLERDARQKITADAFRLNNMIRRRSATRAFMNISELQPLAMAIEKLLSAADEGPTNAGAGSTTETSAPATDQQSDTVTEAPSEQTTPDENAQVATQANAAIDVNAVATSIPAEVFRAYDIRGRAILFSPALVTNIGKAIGSEALQRGQNEIVVGGDGRASYPSFRDQLIAGLRSTGINVTDIGVVASPMLYFACHHLQTQTGVMITGSHNPPDHNGFKVMIGGEFICGDGITALRNRIDTQDYADGQGSYSAALIDKDYIKAVIDDVVVSRRLKVVVDCGNGSGGIIAEELLEALGCDVIPMFCELDPSFPNHQPDPAEPENMTALIAEVRRMKADIGIAFDGDADRIGVVTPKGRLVPADRLLMLLSRDMLANNPGASVVFDVKCSSDMLGVIAKAGGVPLMWRSGHSWIKQKMKEIDAMLGGEFTGHICFRDRWYGFDDGFYCAARLLELLSNQTQTLDDLNEQLPKMVGTPELRIRVNESDKFELERKLIDQFTIADAQIFKFDGIRAELPDSWGLVRASNTSANLSCRFEGRDNDALRKVETLFRDEIIRLIPNADIPF